MRSHIFIELKLNKTHYFLNVLTDPIILSVHFTNRMWCFEYASGFSSLYNVLFSAAKACQGDLCGWLIFSGVYSSTMKICKTEELGGRSYIQVLYIYILIFIFIYFDFIIIKSSRKKPTSVVAKTVCSWMNAAFVTLDLCLWLCWWASCNSLNCRVCCINGIF